MKNKKKTVEEIFEAVYSSPVLVMCDTSIRMRFDEEFVRIMNEKNLSLPALAKQLFVSPSKLRAPTDRSSTPKWMNMNVLMAMHAMEFDLDYVLLGKRKTVLSNAEAALIDNYRNALPENQESLRKISIALTQPEEELKLLTQAKYSDIKREL